MRPTEDVSLNIIREIELHHYEIARNHYEVQLKLQRLRDLWSVKSNTPNVLPACSMRGTRSTVDLHNVLPVNEVFEGLPHGTPTDQWMSGAEAREHYLRCCGVDPDSAHASSLWYRALHEIQKLWGPRKKYSVMRYAVKKRATLPS